MYNMQFLNKVLKFSQKHPFHLVDFSPWPFVASIATFMCTMGSVMYMHGYQQGGWILLLGFLMLLMTMFVWWSDVIRESVFEGHHTSVVQQGLSYGMMLFILSEILFFFGFFWAFFYNSCEPALAMGAMWPPLGIISVNTWKMPFLNTLILLSSGFTVTWTHHAIVSSNYTQAIIGLCLTIFYAFLFTGFQVIEYYSTPFRLSDGIYGTIFYMMTGFHGFHVLMGTIFLSICLFSLISYQFTCQHHFGFEAAVWYWHFVDVIWLFLFVAIYWWGDYPQNLI